MSMLSLPEEIQVDIFVRLPVNSILACRCVCKPLCSLLTKPNFIKNHLNRSVQRNNPRFIVDHFRGRKNRMIYSLDYESMSSSSLLSSDPVECEGAVVMDFPLEYEAGLARMKMKRKKGETVASKILGSCDGLVCLGISTGTGEFEEDNTVCIWNPATREFKKISIPLCDFVGYESKQYFDFLISKDCYNVRYGFGYDNRIDDYKLVRLSDYEDTGSFKMEVYTLGSDSWSTIHIPVTYSFPADYITCGLLFKGGLHWLGITTNQNSSSEVIVSFDVSSDRLIGLSFPEEAMSPPSHTSVYKNLGVLGDCLCLAIIVEYSHVDLWVMQDYGVRESWIKQFRCTQLPPRVGRCSFFEPIWCLESDEILIQTDQDLMLYDQKNETARGVGIVGVSVGSILDCYVESIVSLKSGTYVEKRERSIDGDMKMPPQKWRPAKVNVSALWTDDMEKKFCELLIEQMVGGHVPNLFGNAAWTLVEDEVNRKIGRCLSVHQIKSRYYMLRSRYKEITRFMSSGGLTWDPDMKKVVVDDERVWDAYVKENPDEACYRTLSCPIYEELCVLFGESPVTKSHVPAENNDVETPNLPFKQCSSASNQQEEVGESSNAECNFRGKRIAPLTSKCGPSKKAASNSSKSNDATTRIYVSAAELQNDPYSIPNCTKHLQSLEGVSIRSILAALEKFQDVGWRQVFMSLEPGLQKEWLKSIGS